MRQSAPLLLQEVGQDRRGLGGGDQNHPQTREGERIWYI
jgi:hypothetical protein